MINNFNKLNASGKEAKYLKLFWLGFIIYTICNVFSKTEYFSYIIFQAIQSLCLILIFFTGSYLIRFKFSNKYLKFFYIIYCIWLLLIIIRGFSFEYNFVKYLLFDSSYGIMPYFVPLILFFPKKVVFYKNIFDVIIILGIFYIIYVAVTIGELLNTNHASLLSQGIVEYSSILSFPVSFLLLTFNYHSVKRKIFSAIVLSLTLLFAIYRARRGMIFICSSQIIFAFFLYLINSKKKFLIIFFSIIIALLVSNYIYDTMLKKDNLILGFLTERGTEDTRTGVELSFYSDFKTKDWIFGRGIQGEYYCPNIDENQNTDYRSVIETGYLQIILRGGLISFILILLITLPAIFLGLFYSKNTLSKAAGLWILLWALYLYPATMEAFSLYYILFWISIGICYSQTIRNISETEMKFLFHSKRLN
jgi:hypothetical protein